MATLTQTSIYSRKIIRFGIYAIIFLIIARFAFLGGSKLYRSAYPAPPPDPTVTFGTLPSLLFPETPRPELNLTLETLEGDLPEFIDQTKVFFMPKTPANINALELAQQQAITLGFKPEGQEIVETVFLFPHRTAPSSLISNIVSGIFSISYDLRANPSALEKIPPSSEVATSLIKSYLARAGLLEDDLSGPVTHEFIKIEEGLFVPTVSLSEADLIKVNLYRKSFDELPAIAADPNEANVWFMLSGASDRGDQVIASEYYYYPIDEQTFSTYPIKTAQQAWDELKSGGGFIASVGDNEDGNVTIRRVYIAYYDTGQYAEFLQPIVVFEGDNGFVAYVPAVTSEFYAE